VQPPVLPASQFTAFRVMVVCRKKGCRKRPSWPSTFCTTHAMTEDLLPRKAVAALPTQSPKNQVGFWGTIVFDNEDVLNGGSGVEATVVINRLAVKIDPHLAHLDFVPEPPQTRNKLTSVVRVLELIFELINTSWRPVVIRNFSLDDHGL
jgi:hypothetical protein